MVAVCNIATTHPLPVQKATPLLCFPGNFTCVNISSDTPEFYTNITWGLMPPAFTINISGNTTGCGNVTLTAGGGQSYLWDGGDTPDKPTNTFHASGMYIVTVTAADGCTAYVADSVTRIYHTRKPGPKYIGFSKPGYLRRRSGYLYGRPYKRRRFTIVPVAAEWSAGGRADGATFTSSLLCRRRCDQLCNDHQRCLHRIQPVPPATV